ncbi:MAG: type II secretion system F family protein [Oscillospiraceae bacterium]
MSNNNTTSFGKISTQQACDFCGQVALFLKAGIPMPDGFNMLLSEKETIIAPDILQSISDNVNGNLPLFFALKETNAFPDYLVSMVEVGEQTGKLSQVFDGLAQYYKGENELKNKVLDTITGPFILMIMVAFIILIVTYKIMPIFSSVFASLGMETTSFSLVVMNYGKLIGNISLACVVAALLLEGYIYIRFKFNMQDATEKLTFLKKTSKIIAMQRFCSSLSLMLSSGIMIDEAFEKSKVVTTSAELHKKADDCIEKLRIGESVGDAVKSSNLFSGKLMSLALIGSKSGQFEKVISEIANLYEEEANSRLNKIISYTEFFMVAFLCVIVGMILLSVVLPLIGVMSSLG